MSASQKRETLKSNHWSSLPTKKNTLLEHLHPIVGLRWIYHIYIYTYTHIYHIYHIYIYYIYIIYHQIPMNLWISHRIQFRMPIYSTFFLDHATSTKPPWVETRCPRWTPAENIHFTLSERRNVCCLTSSFRTKPHFVSLYLLAGKSHGKTPSEHIWT